MTSKVFLLKAAFSSLTDYYSCSFKNYPKFCFASVRRLEGRPGEALSKIDQIVRDHPTSAYVPYALLEKAFLLDYTYGDREGAEQIFAQIAATYPDWELTPMVKTRLEAWRQARAGLPEEEKSVVSLSSYHNRANPTTTICLQLPRTARVSVSIHDVLGNRFERCWTMWC